MAEAVTCEGKCCAVFSWPVDWKPGKTTDGEFIADMLIPLTHEQAVARAEKFGAHAPDPEQQKKVGRAPHTCRHWDEETRLCTVYEQRPAMCRNYPYDGACDHGCDFCVAVDIQAAYRLNRERRAPRGRSLRLIVGGSKGKSVVKHAWGGALSRGRTNCGLPLSRARLVRNTATLVCCRRCFRG